MDNAEGQTKIVTPNPPMRPSDYGSPPGTNWPAAVTAALITGAIVFAIWWSL